MGRVVAITNWKKELSASVIDYHSPCACCCQRCVAEVKWPTRIDISIRECRYVKSHPVLNRSSYVTNLSASLEVVK